MWKWRYVHENYTDNLHCVVDVCGGGSCIMWRITTCTIQNTCACLVVPSGIACQS